MSIFFDRFLQLCAENSTSPNAVAKQLSISSGSVTAWKKNETTPRISTTQKLADYFHVTLDYLLGNVNEPHFVLDNQRILDDINEISPPANMPANSILYRTTGMVPVLGRIPAGSPLVAEESIEGYEPVDVPNPESYYWLRVQGDSMTNAGIQSGDLVLIRMQNCAENGQIVACRINGDEATLKRYREQKSSVILMPENPAYDPYIIDKKDFADGYASIMGVAVEVKRKL